MYFANHKLKLCLLFLIALQIISCGKAHKQRGDLHKAVKKAVVIKSCRDCHAVTLDQSHAIPCVVCHKGRSMAANQKDAHRGMIAAPADPDNMRICGKCHPVIVANAGKTRHFTLDKAVNMVRQSFGAKKISSLLQIPPVNKPLTALNLVDDLLRRRCLRCHPYYRGDPYPATRHGTGCAVCHLAYDNGKLISHKFIRPGDKQCLSCHYGNFVGADYYGRFEHNFNWEYRTPFTANDDDLKVRPYGIRFQQLTPDIHQKHGMACIDCHSGRELMGGNGRTKITCSVCHFYKANGPHPANLRFVGGKLWLKTVKGKTLLVPQAVNPAHKYVKTAACQVCHAQWSFNDEGVYLLRQDSDDFEEWAPLTRQGDFEVEKELEASIFQDNLPDGPQMTDKISGQNKAGIWLKSYRLRRWEPVRICRDSNNILQVCRPIMDLYLSYTDTKGKVIFANITPAKKYARFRPYTPHTTGRAGIFFRQRLHQNLYKGHNSS
ncbi:MAG: hypothetical protein GXP59_06170 [Deltaproteobacteria bacterium]|nr:hypothetical protein [Deltaproteobacteria bacterium]